MINTLFQIASQERSYIIKIIMYYPFYDYHASCTFLYSLVPYETLSPPVAEPILEKKQLCVPTKSVRKELDQEIDYQEQNIVEDITLTLQDLKRAGYQKKKNTWTREQDQKLIGLVQNRFRWLKISKEMPGRSVKMCYSRYQRLKNNENNIDKVKFWTKEEDSKLLQLMQTYGQNWKIMSQFFEDRKPKQLRERYVNILMPSISKQPWTLDEDLKLIELYRAFGKKWKQIAEQLLNRSENQVKNRFYGRILVLQHKKRAKQCQSSSSN